MRGRRDGRRVEQVRAFVDSTRGRLRLFARPQYSPGLNPDERMRTHVKRHKIDPTRVAGPHDLKRRAVSALRCGPASKSGPLGFLASQRPSLPAEIARKAPTGRDPPECQSRFAAGGPPRSNSRLGRVAPRGRGCQSSNWGGRGWGPGTMPAMSESSSPSPRGGRLALRSLLSALRASFSLWRSCRLFSFALLRKDCLDFFAK